MDDILLSGPRAVVIPCVLFPRLHVSARHGGQMGRIGEKTSKWQTLSSETTHFCQFEPPSSACRGQLEVQATWSDLASLPGSAWNPNPWRLGFSAQGMLYFIKLSLHCGTLEGIFPQVVSAIIASGHHGAARD